jgi:transcriptional regulator with XRE-family HTH domain
MRALFKNDKQRDIAHKLGITEGMVSLMLSGKRSPSIKLARKIQQVYNIDLNAIYTNRKE